MSSTKTTICPNCNGAKDHRAILCRSCKDAPTPEKKCTCCKLYFPRETFNLRPNGLGGFKRRSKCKQCECEEARIRTYTAPESVRAIKREQKRQYDIANPDKIRRYAQRSSWRNMGLNPDEIFQYRSQHNGLCECCGIHESDCGTLHVDHDHADRTFRGLLCNHCNCGLGHFRDNPERLAFAIEYLIRERPVITLEQKQVSEPVDIYIDESDHRGPNPSCRGENAPWHKLTVEDVADIKYRLGNKEPVLKIVEDYHVTRAAIYQIKYGNNWKQVEPAKRNKEAK